MRSSGSKTVSVIIPIEGTPDKFLITYGDYLANLTWNGEFGSTTLDLILRPQPSRPYPEYFLDDTKVADNDALFVYNGPLVLAIEAIPKHESTLFSFRDGEQTTLISNLDFGNGLGFDGSLFAHSDSVRKVTYESIYNQKTNKIGRFRASGCL